MPDNVHEMWTDEELDEVLAGIRSDVDTDERALARSRAQLLAAAGAAPADESVPVPVRARRRLTWWAASAATVVALVAGLLVVQFGDRPTANAVAKELNSAADQVGATDPPLAPGQYRYVSTHAWWMNTTWPSEELSFSYLEENLLEIWAPADVRQEWLMRDAVTGSRKWIHGTEAEAEAAGVEIDVRPDEVRRAPCGDFYTSLEGIEPCTFEGNWDQPNESFLASLPRDPLELYDQLSDEAESSLEMLDYVAGMLRGGLVPADLRAALYRALAFVPGLRVTEETANLDGRKGVAYGVASDDKRRDVIIDTATGQFIGEREILLNGFGEVPDGTIGSYTSVTTAVVDRMGDRPAG